MNGLLFVGTVLFIVVGWGATLRIHREGQVFPVLLFACFGGLLLAN
jgi:uncharacterized membrane protein YiaA